MGYRLVLACIGAAMAFGALVLQAGATETTFSNPKVGGNRLDWCFTFQHGCGAPAANAWCKTQGYKNATAFSKDSGVGLTRTIGDSSLCSDTNCDSFEEISCFKPGLAVQALLTYNKPEFKGIRLDWCFAWQKQCGKPAAEAFCKSKGHSGVDTFKKAPHVAMTRVISNSQVCDGNCDGFEQIVCQ